MMRWSFLGLLVIALLLVASQPSGVAGMDALRQEDEPSKEELEATIAALQTQVSEHAPAEDATSAPDPTPTSAPSPTPEADEPVEILEVEVHVDDTDGSFYANVRFINNSTMPVSHVGVDGQCLDAAGEIVKEDHAELATPPLEPGERGHAMVWFGQAPTCTSIEVDLDAETPRVGRTAEELPVYVEDDDEVPESDPTPTEEATREPTPTSRPVPTPTPSPTARPSSNQPLEILSVTTKDAGIGDGTIYAYVEVQNNSRQTFSYVGLEGTCRSSSGSIVGHGIGNTMNVVPGDTVVITMLFLQVSGCTDVEVTIDPLTGMFD